MAYSTNGGDDISWGNPPQIDSLSAMSVHCWGLVDNTTADHVYASNAAGSAGSAKRFQLYFDDVDSGSGRTNTIKIFMRLSGNTDLNLAGDSDIISAGGWQSVGVSFLQNSASGLNLYVDGMVDPNGPIATPNESTGIASNPLRAFKGASGDDMVGDVAEVAIWNRELTAGEFAILGKKFSPLFLPRGLVFYAPLIRGLNDTIGSNTGTNTGTVIAPHPPIINPYHRSIFVPAAAAVGGNLLPYFNKRPDVLLRM